MSDLRRELESRTLSSKGLKSQLIARLTKAVKTEQEKEEEENEKKEEVQMCLFIYVSSRLMHCEVVISLHLGPVYTNQHQCCNNSTKTLVILFSLETIEFLKNELQPHSGETPLFSLASSLSCQSVDADAWCKRALS